MDEESRHANGKVCALHQRGEREDLCHWGVGGILALDT
jgi:hypothetical protein